MQSSARKNRVMAGRFRAQLPEQPRSLPLGINFCTRELLGNMDFREKKLYHQIHPLKLATDIGVTPLSLYFLWEHRVLPAVLVGFVPPLVVSLAMLKWMPDLEKVKRSAFGRYIKKYMTPFIELTRLLTLVPMAYGAWNHDFRFIVLGLVILVVAWCNGLIRQVFRTDGP